MSEQVAHVILIGKNIDKSLGKIITRRAVDSIVLLYTSSFSEDVSEFRTLLRSFGVRVYESVVDSSSFQNMLGAILRTIDTRSLFTHEFEFNILCANTTMVIAASIAAIITESPLIATQKNEVTDMDEVLPSGIVSLSKKKREILEYLDIHNSDVYQTNITRDTGIARSCVSRHLKVLERSGLVYRYKKGRKNFVGLTDLGVTVFHHKRLRKERIWKPNEQRTVQSYAPMG